MRILIPLFIALLVTAAFPVWSASAEPVHAVGQAQMQAAISMQVGAQGAQRAAIQSLLARPEVRQLAASAGLDLVRAQAAASNLSGAELQRLAAQATAIQSQLAGGDQTVVISVTVLLLILILIVLLVR